MLRLHVIRNSSQSLINEACQAHNSLKGNMKTTTTRRASQLLKFMKAFPMMILNIKKVTTKEGVNKENYLPVKQGIYVWRKPYTTSYLKWDFHEKRINEVVNLLDKTKSKRSHRESTFYFTSSLPADMWLKERQEEPQGLLKVNELLIFSLGYQENSGGICSQVMKSLKEAQSMRTSPPSHEALTDKSRKNLHIHELFPSISIITFTAEKPQQESNVKDWTNAKESISPVWNNVKRKLLRVYLYIGVVHEACRGLLPLPVEDYVVHRRFRWQSLQYALTYRGLHGA